MKKTIRKRKTTRKTYRKKFCPPNKTISLRDKKKRCINIINRSICLKQNKEFNKTSKKCRIPCKNTEERIMRKDGRGSRCRLKCLNNQERGSKFCRYKCPSGFIRRNRLDNRGTRCYKLK